MKSKVLIMSIFMLGVALIGEKGLAKSTDDVAQEFINNTNIKYEMPLLKGKSIYSNENSKLIMEDNSYYNSTGVDFIVDIPDLALRECVRIQLKKEYNDPILKSDLESLRVFDLVGWNVFDLEGLQYAINIERFVASWGHLTDIDVLSNLTKLKYLDLSYNNITNIESLKSLSQLEYLNLSDNQITNIDSLKWLSQLEQLDLSDNYISDITVLDSLSNLLIADLSSQKIALEPIVIENPQDVRIKNPIKTAQGFVVDGLWLSDNMDYDSQTNEVIVKNVKYNQNLYFNFDTYINLGKAKTRYSGSVNSKIQVLNPDAGKLVHIPDQGLKKAINQALGNDENEDVYSEMLEKLTSLSASYHREITNLEGLQYAKNLEWLDLSDNYSVSDISPLSNLEKLEYLDLSNNDVIDISPLSNLVNLRDLNLSNTTPGGDNRIKDISPLSNLEKLEYLNLSNDYSERDNEVKEIHALSGLVNLKSLDLAYNEVSDLSPLTNLTKLEELNLSSNKVTDVTSLSDLTNLTRLNLSYNRISDLSSLKLLNNVYISAYGQEIILDSIKVENPQEIRVSNPLKGMDGEIVSDFILNQGVHYDENENQLVIDAVADSKKVIIDFDSGDFSGAIYIPIEVENPTDKIVQFADDDLRGEIAFALGLDWRDEIYLSQLELLEELYIECGSCIENLEGLQYAKNLKKFSLNYSEVENFEVLSTLTNLEYLSLYNNGLIDIDFLSTLKKLQILNLSYNNISSLKTISGLKDLQYVDLSYNQIQDLSSLSEINQYIYINIKEQEIILEEILLENPQDIMIESPFILDDEQLLENIFTEENIKYNNKERKYILSGINYSKEYNLPFDLIKKTDTVKYEYNGTVIVPIKVANEVNPIIPVPDENLKNKILCEVGKQGQGELYLSDLESIKSLYASKSNITNLEGLQYATNLMTVYLDGNQISNIDQLANLKNLHTVQLAYNQISDISSLMNHSKLTRLDVSYNQIKGIDIPLVWTKMIILNLSNNQINKITGLNNLTSIIDLYLSNNFISKIEKFETMAHLEKMDLSSNELTEITFSNKMPMLMTLDVSDNNLTHITGLSNLSTVKDLYAESNKLTDITDFNNLSYLWVLDLDNNNISSLNGMNGLSRLECLYLADNKLSSSISIPDLPSLRRLGLSGNSVSSLKGIFDKSKLDYLDLSNNNLTTIKGIEESKYLERLNLSNNQIKDLHELEKFSNLRELNLSSNSLNSLDGLESLKWISNLDVSNNHLSDIGILNQFDLGAVNLDSNHISDLTPLYQSAGWGIIGHSFENQQLVITIPNNQLGLTVRIANPLKNIRGYAIETFTVNDEIQYDKETNEFIINLTQEIPTSTIKFSEKVEVGWGERLFSGEIIFTILSEDEALKDLNNDGVINQKDLVLLSDHYNVTINDSNWNSKYDLNKDGIIDLYDVVLISNKIK